MVHLFFQAFLTPDKVHSRTCCPEDFLLTSDPNSGGPELGKADLKMLYNWLGRWRKEVLSHNAGGFLEAGQGKEMDDP